MFLYIETGWAITAHAVGLGRPMDEHLQTTGKAVPGYDGKSTAFVTIFLAIVIGIKDFYEASCRDQRIN